MMMFDDFLIMCFDNSYYQVDKLDEWIGINKHNQKALNKRINESWTKWLRKIEELRVDQEYLVEVFDFVLDLKQGI